MWYPDPVTARLRHEREARTLYACVGVSIALHGLAMVSLPKYRPAQLSDEPTALTALFASPEPAVTIPLPAPRKIREPRRPEVPATVQKSPEPAAVAAPQEASPEPASTPGPQPAPSQAVASAPVKPPVEAPDASLLDAYRLALIDAAKRNKHYPRQAIASGWEGRVEIRVVVDADGTIKSALVKSPSRYPILNDQALDMVKKALAQIRPAPRGREFTVDVPVVFELQTG